MGVGRGLDGDTVMSESIADLAAIVMESNEEHDVNGAVPWGWRGGTFADSLNREFIFLFSYCVLIRDVSRTFHAGGAECSTLNN